MFTDGEITPDALDAFAALKAAGFTIATVTGPQCDGESPSPAPGRSTPSWQKNGTFYFDSEPKYVIAMAFAAWSAIKIIFLRYHHSRRQSSATRAHSSLSTARQCPVQLWHKTAPGRQTNIAIDHSQFVH